MKIGILISGRGSNMVAIVDAVKSGEIPDSEVAVVISDKPQAAGLAKARERGFETTVIERRGRTREEHDAEIIAELRSKGVELVCLAGYMRLLSPSFIAAFPGKIINIHPSLLPAYPGLNVHEQVLAAGENISGCTVHFVNENLDAGPIILQREVEVLEEDTVETLSARILEQEHLLYVKAIRRVVIGPVRLTSNLFSTQMLLTAIAGGIVFGLISSLIFVLMDFYSYSFYDAAREGNLLGQIWALFHIPLFIFLLVTGLHPSGGTFADYLLIFFYWFFIGTLTSTIVVGVWRWLKTRRI